MVVAAGAVAWAGLYGIAPTPPISEARNFEVRNTQDPLDVVDSSRLPPVLRRDASRFSLLGVVAGASAHAADSVALISIGGGLPRAFHVGDTVEDELLLKSVGADAAALGPADRAATILLTVQSPRMRGPATPPATAQSTTQSPGPINARSFEPARGPTPEAASSQQSALPMWPVAVPPPTAVAVPEERPLAPPRPAMGRTHVFQPLRAGGGGL